MTSHKHHTLNQDSTSGVRDSYSVQPFGDDQQSKAMHDLYNEYKKAFELRNFERVNRIKDSVSSLRSDSPLLNLIYGQNALFSGDGESSYNYLFKYLKTPFALDAYALSIIGHWNKLACNHELALSLFSECMNFSCETKQYAQLVLHTADIKKAQGFFCTALDYYDRLLHTPDGFKSALYIKLQIIHIHLLRGDFEKARADINQYMTVNRYNFVRRLKAYLLYKQKGYRELSKLKNESASDAYVLYLMARMCSESGDYNADVTYYYEEALKKSPGSPAIHNSYANYLFKLGRIKDATIQYTASLNSNPEYKPALNNMSLIKQLRNRTANVEYDEEYMDEYHTEDIDPDVEECGFFNIYELCGYSRFKLPPGFLKTHFDLKPYKP